MKNIKMVNTPDNSTENIKNAPSHIAPHLGVKDYFDIMQNDISYFDDKVIVDIGGGAGLIDLYIQDNAKPNKITIVEPELKKRSYVEIVERARNFFDKGAKNRPTKLKENKLKLSSNIKTTAELFDAMDFDNNPYKYQEEIDRLSNDSKVLKKQIQKMEKNIENQKENAEVFHKFLIGESDGVELNDSSGEEIKGIESNSQDIVFINHLLHKLPEGYYDILKEADRILKDEGEIIIIEYANRYDGGDFFKELCEKKSMITNKNDQSICVKLKKGEYVKLK